MATLTVQSIVETGLEETFASAAGGGDVFANDGRTFFHLVNADASPMTVTVDSLTNCDQGVDHNLVVVVTNAEERMIGPFPPSRFNNASCQVSVTYTSVTSLTVAAVSLSQ